MELTKQELLDKVNEITTKFQELQDYVDALTNEVNMDPMTSDYKDVLADDLSDLSYELKSAWEDNISAQMRYAYNDIERLYDDLLNEPEEELPEID